MNCPICNKEMEKREFLDTKISICLKHGMWIDMKVLEELKERDDEDLLLGFLAGFIIGKGP